MLIAAQARAHDLILVTDNRGEFERIDRLRFENWRLRARVLRGVRRVFSSDLFAPALQRKLRAIDARAVLGVVETELRMTVGKVVESDRKARVRKPCAR